MGALYAKARAPKNSEPTFEEVDGFRAMSSNHALKGIGVWLFPRDDAVNPFSAALREAEGADPAYIPFLALTIHEAPRDLQDSLRRLADNAERSRHRRNGAKTAFFNTDQLALNYLRFLIAGERAGAWSTSCGIGALLSDLALLTEPSVVQKYGNSFHVRESFVVVVG